MREQYFTDNMNTFHLFLARKGWKYDRLLDDSAKDHKHQRVEKIEEFGLCERMRVRRNAATVGDLKKDVSIVEKRLLVHNEFLEDVGL